MIMFSIYIKEGIPGQFNPGDKELENTSINFLLFFRISWRWATYTQDATQSKTLLRGTEASSILSLPVAKKNHLRTTSAPQHDDINVS